jgi:hypothetical protein
MLKRFSSLCGLSPSKSSEIHRPIRHIHRYQNTKASIKVRPFARGGYSRNKIHAYDHDFEPGTTVKPFGIFLPKFNKNYFYFTESNVTADFMINALKDIWPSLKAKSNLHTIAVNTDNRPENNSLRTQFKD